MGFFYLKIILLFFLLCYNSGVMVLYIGGVLMAYFLKVTKQQSRTYLSIYESFYSPETKGTKHRSYRSLGNIQKLIDSGIDDPIAYFQKEVDRLNARERLIMPTRRSTIVLSVKSLLKSSLDTFPWPAL